MEFKENQYKRPPLGKVRNLAEEESVALKAAPHIPLGRFPDLELAVKQGSNYINNLREQYGLTPEQISNSDIRLIEPHVYSQNLPLTGGDSGQTSFTINMSERQKGGAFFDPKTRLCFVKFDSDLDVANEDKKIETAYKISHEIGHKAMNGFGIQDYSFNLNEGFADLIARTVMEGIIPGFLSEKDYFERKARIERSTPIKASNDIIYFSRDVMNCLSDGSLVAYTRVPQMRIIESIARENPEVYRTLFESAIRGSPEAAKETIESNYGLEISQNLSDENADLKTLVDLVK